MTNIPLTGKFSVTCEFKRKNTKKLKWSAGFHTGIDLVGPEKIYATCNGEVTRTDYDKSYGNFIVIKDNTTGKFHWFCHLSKINVSVGTKVTRTTIIGIMGETGNVTGPHLHFEIRNTSNKYGDVSDPAAYMGIPNKVGEYNTANYQIKEEVKQTQINKTPQKKVFKVRTNIRENPTTDAKAYLYKANTTVEILEENVANANGYIWDKVRAVATGRVGYVARTSNRYK